MPQTIKKADVKRLVCLADDLLTAIQCGHDDEDHSKAVDALDDFIHGHPIFHFIALRHMLLIESTH
jgi:hypothetical protein